MVAAKQGQKARLRAGRAFDAAEPKCRQPVFDFIEVKNKVITPQARPLANGRQLGRLEVRESECRQVAPAFGKACQCVDDANQAVAEQLQSRPHQDQIGVVGDVAAGGPKMNDVAGAGSSFGVGVDVRHDIMA